MSDDDAATLDSVAEQLGALTDLFRRRLLDDRAKQSLIDELHLRLERAERERAAESLRPLVTHIALVVERLESTPPSAELAGSVVDELHDILGTLGVRTIGLGTEIDARRHEIVSASGVGPTLQADTLVSVGYEKDGVVLRPARITAVRSGGAARSDDVVDDVL